MRNTKRRTGGRKWMAVILGAVLISVLAAGCGKKEEAAADGEGGVLRVGFLNGGDRFTSVEDGAPVGIEPELAARAAESLGRTLDVTVVDNDTALYAGIQDDSFDLAFGRIPSTESALQALTSSRSYGRGGLFFVTKKYDYTDTLSMLNGGTVGVSESIKGISDEIPGIDTFVTEDYADPESMGRDILAGTIAIGVVNEREALSLISDKLQVQEVLQGPKETYVAVMPKDSSLKSSVDTVIASWYEELLRGGTAEAEETQEE